ncbi:MAG: HD domain-containing protein [Nitrospirae bacterium]|nr:HD domain-containing protein [Nitrospirota bacterium]MBI3605299.1 HD domain-containing protein [Nitrospirota bacterium]
MTWKKAYEGVAMFADPIHEYIPFTTPASREKDEVTEKDLIDTPWVQRLRYVYQLQSARWVYPSAEHTRFQHSLGAMHIASRFAKRLYPSLKEVIKNPPSVEYIEEVLRIAALLHDSGHGPFCHFFDHNFLEQFHLTHEDIGQKIIMDELGQMIKKIKRSPSGPFKAGEKLVPEQIAFLIKKDYQKDKKQFPQWLTFLQPLLGGIYTADNLDYVLRDAYMCGVSIGPVDLDRLIYYTFFSEKGLTLHRSGFPALSMFLNSRLYMYSNVYYHRTTRAIDLHLKEIFQPTIQQILPKNPLTQMSEYLHLTDWSLIEEVRKWKSSKEKEKQKLGLEWDKILSRQVKWKMAFETTLSIKTPEKGNIMIGTEELERKIRTVLSPPLNKVVFRVDMPGQDPRPINPLMMGEQQIYIYNPSTKKVSKEALWEFFDYIPARIYQCRVFTLNHDLDEQLSEAVEKVFGEATAQIPTNI